MDPKEKDYSVKPKLFYQQKSVAKTIDDLPDEVLDYVLSLVSTYGDLRNCHRVSRRWRNAVHRVARNHGLAIEKAMPDMRLLW